MNPAAPPDDLYLGQRLLWASNKKNIVTYFKYKICFLLNNSMFSPLMESDVLLSYTDRFVIEKEDSYNFFSATKYVIKFCLLMIVKKIGLFLVKVNCYCRKYNE